MLATPAISADNLRRLLVLRGISLLAALAMALLARPLFHIQPNLDALLAICAVWLVFGASTGLRTRRPLPPRRHELLLHLAADLALLTLFLAFCGGTANPLTALYLMPVAAAAALLPYAYAWTIAAGAIAAYALLWVLAVPITVEDVEAAMRMHLAGMWLTFGLSAALLVGIVARMSAALRERERQLAAAREQSLRNERIVALGSLAAGAAHRLGTPLNTAILLADEIASNAASADIVDIVEDARELHTQIARCREIINDLLVEAGAANATEAISVATWLTRLGSGLRRLRGDCTPAIQIRGDLGERLLCPEAALTQSLIDLLNNAADASPTRVSLTLSAYGEKEAIIAVRDGGSGFSSAALARAGREPWSDKPHGMGLGLYLARATAERLGGTLECRNTGNGAEVELRLPLAAMGITS